MIGMSYRCHGIGSVATSGGTHVAEKQCGLTKLDEGLDFSFKTVAWFRLK
jgi:hypothetical protein